MAMGEGGAGAALVPPRYTNGGVRALCPSCGGQMQPDASHDGDMVCPECGYVQARGQRFFVDFDFKSVQEAKAGTLVIEGYGNTWDEDRDGESTAKGAFDHSLTEFMTNPVLLLNHQKDQVLGNVVDARPDTKGLRIRAEVDRPPSGAPGWAVKAYADIKSGRLRAFSMGGLFYRDRGGKTINRVDLYEMSVVTIPSNKTSLFRLTGEKTADWDFDPVDFINGKDYSAEDRRRMAKTGEAMSDGSFPIENAVHLRKAVRLWGHADDPAAAKAHIIQRAKALNLVSVLPDAWDVQKSASSTQKGVSTMADENGAGAAGAKSGDGTDVVTVSKKDWDRIQDVLSALAGEKAERDRAAEVERRAKEALEAEAKQKEADQKAADEREAEIKSAVDARIKELRTGMAASATGGRKMVYGASAGSGAPGGKASDGNLAAMMKHLVNAKRGSHDSFKWLEDAHQKAAEFYNESFGEKAYNEGSNSAGGYLVPPLYLQSGLAEFRIAQAKARGLCTVIPGIGTNAVLIPRETGISAVGWTAENAGKPSTDATYGQISVNIFTLAGIAKVSKQLLNDSTPAVDAIVRRGLGKALGQAEDLAVINGSGTGQPTGVLNTGGVLTGAVGTKLWSSIAGSIATIQSNYFANPTAILAHPRDVNTLRTTTDTAGRPIFLPNYWQGGGPAVGGAVSYLAGGAINEQEAAFRMAQPDGYVFGLPVYSDANIPTNLGAGTNETRMIIAAWDEAWVFEREGVTMDVSGEAGTSFEQNQFWFRAELREGFTAARQPSAFYVMTGLTPGAGL